MQEQIRNFSIIAHIDHGKTTLTDRFLRLTNTISEREFHERLLDSNPIEQERGITIKLAPVRMEWRSHILNLIDTPGHVDFSYEVSRSLAACEGAILLVDATQGVQAQTLSHFDKAKALGLKIIPVLNKVDLPAADVEAVSLECMEAFGIKPEEIITVSAKTGENAAAILDAVIERIPAPRGQVQAALQALIFTSYYNQHLGIVASVRVVSGELRAEKLYLPASGSGFQPVELGIYSPEMRPVTSLKTGEVGYVATGLKEARLVRVGDTVMQHSQRNETVVLPGYVEPTPMVYTKLYPIEGNDYGKLQEAMEKLQLHDSSLYFKPTHSPALGNGYQVGFLGLLHAEIVKERLEREFQVDVIATAPSVNYQLVLNNGQNLEIASAAEFPDPSEIAEIREPIVRANIFTPETYVGAIMQLVQDHRGVLQSSQRLGSRLHLQYQVPLAEIITSFYDQLKSLSSGYASLEYELEHYQPVKAVKLSILINKELVEALSSIVVQDKAEETGRKLVKKLKEVIPRQLFEIPIQAAIGGTIIARETVAAYRKDVTAKLYGGDRTRRMKLLKKQAKGKKRMKAVGSVQLNSDTFLAVLKQ